MNGMGTSCVCDLVDFARGGLMAVGKAIAPLSGAG